MLTIFLPLSISGYFFYGSSVESNILRVLTSGPLLTAINVLMATHVFAAFLIAINPVNLLIEDYLKLEHCKYGPLSVFFQSSYFPPYSAFNWKRCSLRTLVGILCIFIGLTIPKFDRILNFVGASAISVQSFVLPPLFYMLLTRQSQVRHAQDLVSGQRRPSDGKVIRSNGAKMSDQEGDSVLIATSDKIRLVNGSTNYSNNYSSNQSDSANSIERLRGRFNIDFITKVQMNIWIKSGLIGIMAMGIFVGISSSIFSLMDLFDPNTFIPPCYVKECKL